MRIAQSNIGPGCPTYIIAEMSANHGQSLESAMKVVRAARDAGANAVKLQTYTADTLTINCRRPEFMVGQGSAWEGSNLHELYASAYTPWEWQPKLKAEAERLGMDCFSTPFDETAVDFLEQIDVPAHKIASFELVDTELLRKVASTGKPVILSTGMALLAEISEAVHTLRDGGCRDLALLKCTSAYPAAPEEMNLRTIPHLAAQFELPVGLSDHTLGVVVPTAAVALGACIVEKHLTLRRADGGPDSAFSLEPEEFRSMVDAVRAAEKSLGTVNYEPSQKEKVNRIYRRSLFAVEDIVKGELLTRCNVRSIRPGHGLPVKELRNVIGRRAAKNIERGTPLSFSDLL